VTWTPEPLESPSGEAGEDFEIRLQALATEWSAKSRDAAQLRDQSGSSTSSRAETETSQEYEMLKSIHDAYTSLATASLDRALQRGTFVVTAAGAIVTLYTVCWDCDSQQEKEASSYPLVASFPHYSSVPLLRLPPCTWRS